VGKGHIKKIEFIDALPYEEPPDEEASYAITLSLMFPDASLRKKLSACWYDLEKRQGKIECMYADPGSGHIWKDHLLLLKEGSTFPKNDQKFYGENRIVRKDDGTLGFDVHHYGYAFTVNTKHVKNFRQD
jgi:CRISPR/Cas system CSM-associated protein Csm4 (group 5 of RAMP superfamily)